MTNIDLRTVLQPTECCVVRAQKNGHLFYNSRTDEMHLVPPTGVLVFQLCDGLRTIDEIEHELCTAMEADQVAVRSALFGFLDKLVTRGILESANVQ